MKLKKAEGRWCERGEEKGWRVRGRYQRPVFLVTVLFLKEIKQQVQPTSFG